MAQVQCVGKASAGTVSSFAFTITSSGAHPLIVALWDNIVANVTSVTDNLGQTWTLRENTGEICFADCLGSASGVTTVTVNFGSAAAYNAFIMERDEVLTFDQKKYLEQGTTTAPATGNVTTTSATEIALGIFGTFSGNSQSFAAGSGWTAITGTGITAGHIGSADANDAFMETRTLSSIGNYQADGTCDSSYCYVAIATYAIAATAGNLAWIRA